LREAATRHIEFLNVMNRQQTALLSMLQIVYGRRQTLESFGGEGMDSKFKGPDRRKFLTITAAGGVITTLALPSRWTKPIVKSVIVPAHAEASPAEKEHTTKPPVTTPPPVTSQPPTTPPPTTTKS
jgi:hypothetical protein